MELKSAFHRDACILMFTAAQYTTVRIWNQPRCPSIGERIKKNVVHIYTVEYYSLIEKNILSIIEKWMDLEIIMLNEISQTQRLKYYTFWLHVESKKEEKKVEDRCGGRITFL